MGPVSAWNAVFTSEAHDSRFGYINVKGAWAVTLKAMPALP